MVKFRSLSPFDGEPPTLGLCAAFKLHCEIITHLSMLTQRVENNEYIIENSLNRQWYILPTRALSVQEISESLSFTTNDKPSQLVY